MYVPFNSWSKCAMINYNAQIHDWEKCRYLEKVLHWINTELRAEEISLGQWTFFLLFHMFKYVHEIRKGDEVK